MALNKQMEMFEDGGLKDEGGMIDEVSGNDVPSGSTREEVRDDIPAQLSEGEFVFPADVVRFIGLEKLMQLRQEAKQGLKQMEAMGQMGNSDEATMRDDMPFDINDLDMEDEVEYNRGGVVEAANGTFVQNAMPITYNPLNTTQTNTVTGNPTQMQPTAVTSNPYTGNPQTAYNTGIQPYAPVDYTTALGTSAVGAPKTESVRYFNATTGQSRTIPHMTNADGSRGATLFPVPEGFVIQEEAPKEEAKKTTQVQSTQVQQQQDDGGGSEPMGSSTKDQSFTDINVSTLKSEELKKALSSVSILSQLGQFSPALGLRDAVKGTNATARNMGAAIGGMLDNFRGGTVEFTSKGMNTNYNDTRSLNDLSQVEQDKLGKVAAATVQQAKVTFFNYNPKTKEYDIAKQQKDVIAELDRRAKEYGLKRGNKTITRFSREIFKEMAKTNQIVQDLNEKYKDGDFYDVDSTQARANRAQVIQNQKAAIENFGTDTIESSYDPSDYQSFTNESGDSVDPGSIDDAGGSFVGDDPFNKGGLAGKKKTPKPKKMKRGGLASR